MIEKEMYQTFKNLTQNQKWILLSNINTDGIPETRAMINLANPKLFPNLQQFFDDSFTAYFSTATRSDKIGQFTVNSNASIYYYDEKMEGLLLMGNMEIIMDQKVKEEFWQDSWTMYYPKGVTDPDYSLLKFTPDSYKFFGGLNIYKAGNL